MKLLYSFFSLSYQKMKKGRCSGIEHLLFHRYKATLKQPALLLIQSKPSPGIAFKPVSGPEPDFAA